LKGKGREREWKGREGKGREGEGVYGETVSFLYFMDYM